MQECWEMSKKEFVKDRFRVSPRCDIDEPFEVSTDFSSTALAAIVSQKQNGEEKFIAAVGRKTTKYEKNILW